ncbi:MAG: hypothetical protein MAGBODY4_00701 [Candidatus Marinimicrobia bacterium]|nr:hypothetical protein [Candidatus Neomarinimicrobiota bacterium]
MSYRQLTDNEITILEKQGCEAENWNNVLVTDPFHSGRYRQVRFSGEVKIDTSDGTLFLHDSVPVDTGIHQCHIHNCTIGENVYISNVGLLANYSIGKEAVVRNVNSMIVNGPTSFGNGAELEILNEGGGRTLNIYNELTAQIAYLMVFYRHRPQMIARFKKMIADYAESQTGSTGIVGDNAVIQDCDTILNLHIGPLAEVSGARHLENGSLVSTKDDPIFIGSDVIAENFIVQSGSHLTEGALLEGVFVGQGVRLGKQLSAENCAFFANSEAFHSEAVALFAGPYTVTHHRSSLLIAEMVSFYNTGSGTNQSNHMYKLGPNHQGIYERGSKTGSFAYLLWPSHVGPYSVVLGKHHKNIDISDLPFSYLDTDGDASVLTPAMNLFTVGTRRDTEKWPNRDKRKDAKKHDLLTFKLLNPYIVEKILRGIDILQKLYDEADSSQKFVQYNGGSIKRLMLKMGIKYYQMAVKIAMGECLSYYLKHISGDADFADIKKVLISKEVSGYTDWRDLSGMIAPGEVIDELCTRIEQSHYSSINEIADALIAIHKNYSEYEWASCVHLMEGRYETKLTEFSREQMLQVIRDWKENAIKLNNMILKDAEKEFNASAKISYGLDVQGSRDADFENVRGKPEENSFISNLQADSEEIEKTAEELTDLIANAG